jgi:hypothetical protein
MSTYRGDGQTSSEKELKVVGGQNFWFVTPRSIHLSAFFVTGKISKATADKLVLHMKNIWCTYDFTLAPETPVQEGASSSGLNKNSLSGRQLA